MNAFVRRGLCESQIADFVSNFILCAHVTVVHKLKAIPNQFGRNVFYPARGIQWRLTFSFHTVAVDLQLLWQARCVGRSSANVRMLEGWGEGCKAKDASQCAAARRG